MIITRFDDEEFVREKKRLAEEMRMFREVVTCVHAEYLFSDAELKKRSEEWLLQMTELRLRFIYACGALNEDIGEASFTVKEEIKSIKRKIGEK